MMLLAAAMVLLGAGIVAGLAALAIGTGEWWLWLMTPIGAIPGLVGVMLWSAVRASYAPGPARRAAQGGGGGGEDHASEDSVTALVAGSSGWSSPSSPDEDRATASSFSDSGSSFSGDTGSTSSGDTGSTSGSSND